jgi:Zn-finger protein
MLSFILTGDITDMRPSYRYHRNKKCEYFPCHQGINKRRFNCLFCYCPLYPLGNACGGSFRYTEKGIKDCSGCIIPHSEAGYAYIRSKIDDVVEMTKSVKP